MVLHPGVCHIPVEIRPEECFPSGCSPGSKSADKARQDIAASPFAREGFPVGLRNIRPSGVAKTLAAPLRRTFTPHARAEVRAAPVRSSFTSFGSFDEAGELARMRRQDGTFFPSFRSGVCPGRR
jgi:hypothetical protein